MEITEFLGKKVKIVLNDGYKCKGVLESIISAIDNDGTTSIIVNTHNKDHKLVEINIDEIVSIRALR